jgi:hypothetical protein
MAQAPAQQSSNPLTTVQMPIFSSVENYLIRSAEKMPEAKHNFKPVPEVPSFGQILAHVPDANAAVIESYYGGKAPKLSALSGTTTHNMEHCGNQVTCMRIKGLVPPSSEPRQ